MTKADRIPLAALMVLAFALWIPWMRGPIDLRWDAGVYYILGSSLAQGKGYRLLNEPGDPQAVQYPPLLPLFIGAQQRLLGTSDPVVVGKWLRWLNQLMLMGCAALTYLLARQWLSRWLAFLAAMMFLLSLHTYFMGSLAFAEVPFALASLLFLLPRRASWPGDIWSGTWAIVAYLLRTIGIALLVTWVAEAALRARWRAAIVRAVVAMLPVILWQGYVYRVEASPQYQHPAYLYQRAPYQFNNVTYSRNVAYIDPYRPELGLITRGQLIRRTLTNLLLERRSFPETVTTDLELWDIVHSWIRPRLPLGLFHLLEAVVAYTIAALMLVGLASMTLDGEWRVPLYVALSALAIAATPWPSQFSRYFWPLSPLLAIAFIVGVIRMQIRLDSTAGRTWNYASSTVLVLVIATAISVESAVAVFNWVRSDFKQATYIDSHKVIHPYRLFHYDQRWQNFDRAVDWIQREAAPNEVIVTGCPHYLYLRARRKAVMPPMENDPDRAEPLLGGIPAAYLIADDFGFMGPVVRNVIDSVTSRYPLQWKMVAIIRGSKTFVYKRVGSPEPSIARPSASFVEGHR
jgi:hypothetical protein